MEITDRVNSILESLKPVQTTVPEPSANNEDVSQPQQSSQVLSLRIRDLQGATGFQPTKPRSNGFGFLLLGNGERNLNQYPSRSGISRPKTGDNTVPSAKKRHLPWTCPESSTPPKSSQTPLQVLRSDGSCIVIADDSDEGLSIPMSLDSDLSSSGSHHVLEIDEDCDAAYW